MGFMDFLRGVGRAVAKPLEFGGKVLKGIGEFGGQAVKFLGEHAPTIGKVVGAAVAPFAPKATPFITAIGDKIGQLANSKPVSNVLRGVNDVGKAAAAGASMLKPG